MKEVYIVSAVRTAMGSFGGTLAGIPATKLGAIAIKGALDRINLDGNLVNEVYMGCVLQANLGQAPARQAAKFAGLPDRAAQAGADQDTYRQASTGYHYTVDRRRKC